MTAEEMPPPLADTDRSTAFFTECFRRSSINPEIRILLQSMPSATKKAKRIERHPIADWIDPNQQTA
ncbi:hypothetical protein XYCOK13_16780 [Xylanibacillus composti]|uniref:Uncharacterized protein n=1 Tax=Xylanibacillus composti TaxID=1572762 RepID=A0A8J4M1Q0_9BACL|nr:hypothetical protein XYCOK13_16780 [Xylanibacillus composti]